MRNMIWVAAVVAWCGCGSTGTGDDDDVIDAGNSDGDGNALGDGSIDGPPISYAPCDTCCDPIAQDCGATQACYTNSSTSTSCEPAGTGQVYSFCLNNTDCVAGTMCFYGQCQPYCVTDADCATSVNHHCEVSPAPPGRNAYGLCF
jgi:hypothetical protein